MKLKEIRTRKQMTQGEVAKACGITQGCYNHWEQGNRNPKPEMLRKLSQVLDCTIDELVGDCDDERRI